MKKKVYIIGSIQNEIDCDCEDKFYRAHVQLLKMGFDVVNPIERLTNKNMLPEEAKRKNLQDLLFSNAVYIMPCINLGESVTNLEIKLALDFNLIVFSGILDLNPKEPECRIKSRKKKSKIVTN